MYHLNTATMLQCMLAYAKSYSKAKHSKARRAHARGEHRPATAPALAATSAPWCQSKIQTFYTLCRMALYQAQAYRHRLAAAPAPLAFPARELRVRTTQDLLTDECGCTDRTLRRHLKAFEAVGLVTGRRQLGVAVPGAPSFQFVLNAAFLDWEEVPAPGQGTPRAGAGHTAPPAPAAAPASPAPAGEPAAPAVDPNRILRRTAERQAADPKPPA